MEWRRFFLGDHADQREHARAAGPVGLWCTLGDVVDISISGLRIACVGKAPDRPGRLENFTLSSAAGELAATARVVRVDKRGWKRFEIGLEFLGLTAPQLRLLELLTHASGAGEAHGGRTPGPQPSRVPDYYAVLGVPRDAAPAEIRTAFHNLAHRLHPDATHTGDTAREFQRMHDAYAVLKDTAARAEYDTKLNAQNAAALRA